MASKIVKSTLALALLASASFAARVAQRPALHLRKQVSGPPSEFTLHKIPNPEQAFVTSNSQTIHVHVAKASSVKNGVTWSTALYVDGADFAFSVLSPIINQLSVTLLDPSGNAIPLENHLEAGNYPITDDSANSLPQKAYSLSGQALGEYTLVLVSESLRDEDYSRFTSNTVADGLVLYWDSAEVAQYTHLQNYNLLAGSTTGVIASVYDPNAWDPVKDYGTKPTALKQLVQSAILKVAMPDGAEKDIEMHDDGLHGDGAANDGTYGAQFTPATAGTYLLRTELGGVDSLGRFIRTASRSLTIISDTLQLASTAIGVPESGNQKMKVDLQVLSATAGASYRAYAEVWGTSSTGDLAPACFIQSITDVIETNGALFLPLELDLSWLAKAGVQEPLVLQNVYVADVNTNIPISQAASIPLSAKTSVRAAIHSLNLPEHIEVTKEMLEGKNPLPPPGPEAAPTLVLSHGYCSKANPWAKTQSVWPANSLFFEDFGQSLSNDQFALNILDLIAQNNAQSVSTIGHSQGGLALLHLYNYYFSSVDYGTSGRLIQSVGSPYRGNNGAGTGADLIKIFGFGCGSNDALTRDGAELWLSGITSAARSQVYYYTTQYKECFGCHCAPGVGLVLSKPNDGTAELTYSQLEGGNNQGNTHGQCHTEGMNYEAQCLNVARNELLAKNAF